LGHCQGKAVVIVQAGEVSRQDKDVLARDVHSLHDHHANDFGRFELYSIFHKLPPVNPDNLDAVPQSYSYDETNNDIVNAHDFPPS